MAKNKISKKLALQMAKKGYFIAGVQWGSGWHTPCSDSPHATLNGGTGGCR